MARFFVTLSYDGTNYVGWQIQPNGISVQQKIQDALSLLFKTDILVVGAGRTDAGVHAAKMVVHFDSDQFFDKQQLVRKLNSFLPRDIAIEDIREVRPDAHARFSALSRTYRYYITTQKNPFRYQFMHRLFFEPDLSNMNHLCDILKEYDDFTSFSKLHTDAKTNICRVTDAFWTRNGSEYIFEITADRFLRNMVRAVVGTLLVAGKGSMDEKDFRQIIESKNRQNAGSSAPGKALFLEEIVYPNEIWI